jgi:hypothetical protein
MYLQMSAATSNNGSSNGSIKVIQEMFQVCCLYLQDVLQISSPNFQDYNDFGYKQALAEFDQAIAHRYSTIVIEPANLG